MKAHDYKNLLKQLNKKTRVVVTVSLWTYSSKRMTFAASFDELDAYLDGDMRFKHFPAGDLSFQTLTGRPVRFKHHDLKIAKVDFVQMDDPVAQKGADSE